ncbi:N-acylneuraminate cytidylyltransferase [Runella defluvii]|uniref:N-acylneuraminate cytidylyltransferase n=1 Tax=Runella defluvii TaxID=370973 RepID=A0A7W5ZPE3_9BACT|nr:acylneuraminate cytidylyltransferase family protein [Runella defluvii]MBB3840546.1 N-acylneuraminate cytidylyltransferase [Runella defluvii]
MAQPNVLAIIQARGGSKGLPNKNLLPLAGHPLVAYSVKAALETPSITRTIISTDSQAIADAAQQYGAEVPFLRPAEFAQDLSTDFDVFTHALNWFWENEGYRPDLVVQLRPTSPVRSVRHIDEAIQTLWNTPEADSIRTITPSPITPYKMWVYDPETATMQPLLSHPTLPEFYNEPRQKLPPVHWHIGNLDVIRPHVILDKKSMSGYPILPYVLPFEYAIDIDDLAGFRKAEETMNQVECVRFE